MGDTALTTAELVGTDGITARYGCATRPHESSVDRPALHPVVTPAGVTITGEHPADHPWHRGIGIALPEVNGVNLWGGPTYVRGRGYVDGELGMVRRARPPRCEPNLITDELSWCDGAGQPLLHEQRAITLSQVAGGARLEWSSVLIAPDDRDAILHSPGSKGRAGAGYGGFFWRLPVLDPGIVSVYTATAGGEDEVNGSVAPWVTVAVGGDRPFTATLSASDSRTTRDPWFVRVREYQGIGSALAWDRPVVLRSGSSLPIGMAMTITDGTA